MAEPLNVTRHHVALYVALFILSIIGIAAWEEGRNDKGKLAATIEAQKTVIDAAQKERDAHQAADKERDAQTAATIAAMQDALAKVKTPQQIANWIPQQLPLPQPITVQLPPATPQNPAPDAIVAIPQADLIPLRDTIEKCKECAIKLSTAQQDLTSRDERLALAGQQMIAVQKERDAALTAAKGGIFFTRAKRIAKWLAIGAAAGYVISQATQHKNP
jgi:hypothetical protein